MSFANSENKDQSNAPQEIPQTIIQSVHSPLRTYELDEYNNKRGGCETWWTKSRTLLVAARIDQVHWFTIVMKALKGEANHFFWQESLASEGKASVDDIMVKLIDMFDIGQLEDCLRDLMITTQGDDESMLQFKARFEQMIKSLAKFNLRFDDSVLMTLFGIKIKPAIWEEVKKHGPKTIKTIMDFVALNLRTSEIVQGDQIMRTKGSPEPRDHRKRDREELPVQIVHPNTEECVITSILNPERGVNTERDAIFCM